jgi:hypothetical protein
MSHEGFSLTRKGKRLLRSGKTGMLSPEAKLLLIISDKVGGRGAVDNIGYLAVQLLDRFGGADAAIDAINAGAIGFEKAN